MSFRLTLIAERLLTGGSKDHFQALQKVKDQITFKLCRSGGKDCVKGYKMNVSFR